MLTTVGFKLRNPYLLEDGHGETGLISVCLFWVGCKCVCTELISMLTLAGCDSVGCFQRLVFGLCDRVLLRAYGTIFSLFAELGLFWEHCYLCSRGDSCLPQTLEEQVYQGTPFV